MTVFLVSGGAAADDLTSSSESANGYTFQGLHHFACLQNDMVRLISVEYSGREGEAPCSVVYEKSFPEEPSKEILWHAEHNTSYCELRVREFVEMLRSWNWKCGLFRDILAGSDKAGSSQPRAVKSAEDTAAPAESAAQ